MIIGIAGKKNSGKDEVGKIIQYLTSNINIEGVNNTKPSYEFFKTIYKDFEYDWQIKKFADKLKDIVCLLIGCTREQLEDREFKEKELGEEWWIYKFPNNQISSFIDKKDVPDFWSKYLIKSTPRKILQLLGTEAGRNIIHPNIWVNSLFAGYKDVMIKQTQSVYSEDAQSFDGILNIPPIYDKPNWIITDVRFPNEAQAIKDRGGIIIRVNRDYILAMNEEDPTKQHESEIALDHYKGFNYTINNDSDIKSLIKKVKIILEKEKILECL